MSDEIKGLDDLLNNIENLGKLPQAFADEFLQRVKDRTPVATGLLKNSWVMQVKDGSIELRNTAVNKEGEAYAQYVEMGTYKERPALMITATNSEAGDVLDTAKKKVGL